MVGWFNLIKTGGRLIVFVANSQTLLYFLVIIVPGTMYGTQYYLPVSVGKNQLANDVSCCSVCHRCRRF